MTYHASTGKPKCILDQRNSSPMGNIPICWLVSHNAASLSPPSGLIQVHLISHLFLQGTVLCDSNLSRCSGDSEGWSTTFAACAIHSRIVGPRTGDRLWWRGKTQHVNIKFEVWVSGDTVHLKCYKLDEERQLFFFNQSINQPINQSINQTNNQSIKRSRDQSTSQSVCLSINKLLYSSTILIYIT